ncbi:MAG: prolyl oligopeptidase family serine peptidase [Saprospiraceae bacterium]
MRSIFFLLVCIFFTTSSNGQEFVSATLKGSRTKAQLISQFSNPLIKNGTKYYAILYTSLDAKGAKDTLSGLLAVPDDLRFKYPRLIYQHGTSDCKNCVPSRFGATGGEEGQVGLIGCGLGYITYLPDYVGMGNGRGFQTYVHAATIQRATDDFVTATEQWLKDNGVIRNDQMFITGYSQGGYSSMAYHKFLEENGQTVTAAAHLSGPYSMSNVMRDLILGDIAYSFPAYLPNTALGYQEVYGDLYSQLSDIFKPDFFTDIQLYYNHSISLFELNDRLYAKLTTQFGSSVAKNMIQPDYLAEVVNNSNARINQVLLENDVYKWIPKAPTRIFYCTADDQVPFMNSIVAKDYMLNAGATKLQAFDVSPNANHGACFNPALTQTIIFFLGFQQITSSNGNIIYNDLVKVAPNPVMDRVNVSFPGIITGYALYDFVGNEILSEDLSAENSIEVDVQHITSGLYLLRLKMEGNILVDKKLIKQ